MDIPFVHVPEYIDYQLGLNCLFYVAREFPIEGNEFPPVGNKLLGMNCFLLPYEHIYRIANRDVCSDIVGPDSYIHKSVRIFC